MSITAQEVIKDIKAIGGALVGMSRQNPTLYRDLHRKCLKLEKKLISSCDELVVGPSLENKYEGYIKVETFNKLLLDDSLSKAEILKLLEGESFEQSSTSEDETSQEEATGSEVNGRADEETEGDELANLLAEDAAEDGTNGLP